ncbi:MAG: anti-sigma factor [Saccharopolyspora sp.]|uniref:anti-sigma factor n=1 Tax=Saccharopolyspora TaxID=1835 RepID=UPI00190CDA92|nr:MULTISPECIES: anti-sigma factor [unclassified Saccharopolyspora]MBK0868096.1 anti-sigma factor [Saccharopolyspora sp. HNM0986]MBQ6644183.1 anti-sigma factor [Saccharopolyspora sp.]
MSTDLATLTGAYAVDALPDDERAEFELHMAGCEDCRQEVRELREAAARLAATEQSGVPDGLKQRVLAEVAQTRQDPPPPAPLAQARARRKPWGVRLAAVAAVLGIALAGAFGVLALRAQQELADTKDRMIAAGARGDEMSQVLQAPDTRVLNSAGPSGSRATAIVSQQMGKAMFMTSGMAPAPSEHDYQLWFIGADGATPAGLLEQGRGDGTEPMMAAMPAGTATLGVTVEPDGGSPAPTTPPIMTVPLAT